MRIRIAAVAVVLALCTLPAHDAPAWEATTTHAGLTERAAITSKLHERLKRQFNADRGLYTPLTVPPPDARPLFSLLRKLNPSHGYVPDGRGRLYAMGWLAAGSVVADTPTRHALNHFFDPTTKKGAGKLSLGVRDKWLARLLGDNLPSSSANALDWITDKRNPMNLTGFYGQYAKAVTASTPAERSRHLAGALVAAGALLHVLQDMGSPSHVRNDLSSHLQRVGNPLDIGSRFERVAEISFGRLGVPSAKTSTATRSLHALFTNPKKTGLADTTARSWFSASTLPRTIELDHITVKRIVALVARHYKVAAKTLTAKPAKGAKASVARAMAIYLSITHTNRKYAQLAPMFGVKRTPPLLFAAATIIEGAKADPKIAAAVSTLKGTISAQAIGGRLDKSLRRAAPAPLNTLDLASARHPRGARLVNANGVCVARYRLRKRMLSWSLDDECIIEQLRVILPRVASFGAGALNWLFRGEVTLRRQGNQLLIGAHNANFGKGALELFWDDNRGVRTAYAKVATSGGKARTAIARGALPPKKARRISVLFRGVDKAGNPMVATGTVRWPGTTKTR